MRMRIYLVATALGVLLLGCASTQPRDNSLPASDVPVYPTTLPTGEPFALRVLHRTYAPGEVKPKNIRTVVMQPLWEKYAEDHNLAASDEEVAQFNQAMSQISKGEGKRSKNVNLPKFLASRFIVAWKIDRALYNQYGGTVIFQQMNPSEPVGAYRAFLEASEARGDFVIPDESLRTEFWSYFTQEHSIPVHKQDVDFSVPWWSKAASKSSEKASPSVTR